MRIDFASNPFSPSICLHTRWSRVKGPHATPIQWQSSFKRVVPGWGWICPMPSLLVEECHWAGVDFLQTHLMPHRVQCQTSWWRSVTGRCIEALRRAPRPIPSLLEGDCRRVNYLSPNLLPQHLMIVYITVGSTHAYLLYGSPYVYSSCKAAPSSCHVSIELFHVYPVVKSAGYVIPWPGDCGV